MRERPEYSVVVPAYNEEVRLRAPLLDILSHFRDHADGFEVVVVDDGSTDATPKVVRTLQEGHRELRLIRLPANRGKGFAVRTGVLNTTGRFVLIADADGATPIDEVRHLRNVLDQGADVVIGSRALEGRDVRVETRLYRKFIGRIFHKLVELLAVGEFRDTQCGFKLFRGPVARELLGALRIDGFAFDVELLAAASCRAYRVEEVPVNWTHVPGSRIDLAVDSLRMLRDLITIRALLHRGVYDPAGTGYPEEASSGTEPFGLPK